MSWYQMLAPVFGLGIVVAFLVTMSTTTWVPKSSRELKSLIIKVTSTRAVSLIRPGAFTDGVFDLTVFAERTDSKTNRLENVFLFDSQKQEASTVIVARKGQIIPQSDPGKTFASSAVFQMQEGSLFRVSDDEDRSASFIHFRDYQMFKENEDSDAEAATKPKAMTIKELEKHIREKTGHFPYGRPAEAPYLIEWHNRFALGFGCVIFSLLGPALGVVHARTGRKSSLLVTLVVLGGYYALFLAASPLAEKGIIPSWLAAWVANIIAMALAISRLRRI
jgi:lipopolysaccharide export LptBFGC system permease protein LptF